MSLLGQLGLEHEPSLDRFVEVIGAVSESIVAELLGDALRVGTLRSMLNEVVQEAEDLKVERLQRIILIIVKLLCDRVIVSLKEVLALLVASLLVLHAEELVLLAHLLLELGLESLLDFSDGRSIELLH